MIRYLYLPHRARWIIQYRDAGSFFWRTVSHSFFDPIYFLKQSEAIEYAREAEISPCANIKS